MSRKVFISSAAQSEESIFMCSYWWLQTIFSAWCFDIWSWIYVYIYIYTHTYIHTVLGHFSYVRLCVTLWTHQAPLSIGFSRQEHWSGLPCPPPGDLPDSGIKPASFMSPALPGDRFFTIRATWEAYIYICLWRAVLCIIECLTVSLTSTYETLGATLWPHLWEPKISPGIAKYPLTKCSWLRSIALEEYKDKLEKYVSRGNIFKRMQN